MDREHSPENDAPDWSALAPGDGVTWAGRRWVVVAVTGAGIEVVSSGVRRILTPGTGRADG